MRRAEGERRARKANPREVGEGINEGLLPSDEVVEGGTREGYPHFLWITSARPGTVVKRDAGLRQAVGLDGKWPAGKGIG